MSLYAWQPSRSARVARVDYQWRARRRGQKAKWAATDANGTFTAPGTNLKSKPQPETESEKPI